MSSSNSRWRVGPTLLVLSVGFTSVAHAEPTDGDRENAKALYVEGMELREQGKKKEALAKFKLAYELVPSPITGLAVGVACEETGDFAAALATYADVARLPPKANESAEAKTARSQVALRRDALDLTVPRVRIRVAGLPPDTPWDVTIDDQIVHGRGTTPFTRRVNAGAHRLQASAKGQGKTSAMTVVVVEKQDRAVELTFIASTQETDAEPRDTASPPPARRTDRSNGLALGAGYGYQTAGLGIVAAYYIRASNVVRITPYLGGGHASFAGPFGAALGVMASLGEAHRVVVDCGWGFVGAAPTPSAKTAYSAEYGMTPAGGYEYMSTGGTFVRLTVGASFKTNRLDDPHLLIGHRPSGGATIWTLSLTAGYKLF